MYDFRWNDWNRDHIGQHDVDPEEAEYVVRRGRRPWPEYIGHDKWRVWGQTLAGRYLQVIYVFDDDDTVYVLHARNLSESDKRRYRGRKQ